MIAVERGAEGARVRWWVWVTVAAALGIAVAGVSLAPLRTFFEVARPTPSGWALIATAGLGGGLGVIVAARLSERARP